MEAVGHVQLDQTRTVQIDAAKAASPRDLALELMLNHDLAGDLRQINESDGLMKFRIVRPGTHALIEYVPGSDEVEIKTQRWGWLEMLVQLHVTHGFHHDFLPAGAWALLSLLGSIALLLLGGTGIYLWFVLQEERVVGSILLTLGLIYGLTSLIWSRMV